MSNPNMEPGASESIAPRWLVIGLLATAIVILLIEISGQGNKPGFLGSFAPLIADINLITQFALLIILVLGLIAIKRKNTARHRILLTTVVLSSIVLTVLIMAGRLIMLFSGGADQLILFHGILGLTAILMGSYLILHMNDRLPQTWRTKKWKLMMRVTWLLFLAVTLVGLTVYWKMYIP